MRTLAAKIYLGYSLTTDAVIWGGSAFYLLDKLAGG